METPPQYNSQESENKIYQKWQKSGFFNPDKLPNAKKRKPFTITMPPPNANGSLHAGHAVFVTLEDLMIRFQRMRGRRTLLLPGADHAGFETQVVFDKKLEKEGRSRSSISREALFEEMFAFTQANKKVMEGQLEKLGASCDWSREQFTLDPHIVKGTQDTFMQMYNDGLLYRGERIVNWCVKHQTTLSDLEVKYEERIDPLYYLQYGPFMITTARPETKFSDKYIVVHPQDKRYTKFKDGEQIETEWINGPVRATVIKDRVIDMSFGTGAMTITPWHDAIDFELSIRRKLDKEPIIDRYGKLLPVAGEFSGMKITEARQKIGEKLKSKGLLIKIDPNYTHNVAVCYKCGSVVEPRVLPQWWLSWTKPLNLKRGKEKSVRDLAVQAVIKDEIKFVPERFKKIFLHWMKNLLDWNISRQITWGIRIPAWYCGGCEGEQGTKVQIKKPTKPCPTCKQDWQQDPDVLDTWFSSGQWPYLTLGYPKGNDFKTYYPTDVMETAADILLFWVARMVLFGYYRTGKKPFSLVYLHGLIRDKDRQKMSKSKGNVIDPLGVIETYGADALRMALIVGNLPGNDSALSEDKIRGYRNFTTKIWNINRFILMRYDPKLLKVKAKVTRDDKKRLTEVKKLVKDITKNLEEFKFHHAAEMVYHYVWHTFADKIIESAKPHLESQDAGERAAAQALILEIHTTVLKLLHPFMPFITEAVWETLPTKNKKFLMVEEWPK